MALVLSISRRPAARIRTVVAAVVDYHLLYNETSLADTRQMEVLIGMIES